MAERHDEPHAAEDDARRFWDAMRERLQEAVSLPAPEPAGEALAKYVKRAIVEDPVLLELRARSRTFPPQLFRGRTLFFRNRTEHGPDVSEFPIEVGSHFIPARFSLSEVVARHNGFDRVDLGISERLANLLDGLWTGRTRSLPR